MIPEQQIDSALWPSLKGIINRYRNADRPLDPCGVNRSRASVSKTVNPTFAFVFWKYGNNIKIKHWRANAHSGFGDVEGAYLFIVSTLHFS